jgi:hypothetical protein
MLSVLTRQLEISPLTRDDRAALDVLAKRVDLLGYSLVK